MMNKLFSEFDSLSTQQWKDKLSSDLKGKTFEDLTNSDGTLPFYHSDTHQHFKPLSSPHQWMNVQWIDGSNAKEGNRQALEALNNGMNALCFSNPTDLPNLFKDILIQHIEVHFENYSSDTPKLWEQLVADRGIDPEDANGSFFGQEEGELPNFYYHSVMVDDIHQAVEDGYINSQYIFTIGSDYFKEIAKMRAFVSLFETHFQGFPNIFAKTSLSNKESEEPYTNLLRTTTESMSAILGGCDALMIRPYNQSFEAPNDFSNRLARNQHHILLEESFLGKVQDPSAGSYYIETLTQQFLKGKREDTLIEIDIKSPWKTAEQIEVKRRYTSEDIEGLEHLGFGAGLAPNLRGPYSSMYVSRPWTIRQYAGFSTAEASMLFTEEIWKPDKKDCQSLLTLPHTAVTIPITNV